MKELLIENIIVELDNKRIERLGSPQFVDQAISNHEISEINRENIGLFIRQRLTGVENYSTRSLFQLHRHVDGLSGFVLRSGGFPTPGERHLVSQTNILVNKKEQVMKYVEQVLIGP